MTICLFVLQITEPEKDLNPEMTARKWTHTLNIINQLARVLFIYWFYGINQHSCQSGGLYYDLKCFLYMGSLRNSTTSQGAEHTSGGLGIGHKIPCSTEHGIGSPSVSLSLVSLRKPLVEAGKILVSDFPYVCSKLDSVFFKNVWPEIYDKMP